MLRILYMMTGCAIVSFGVLILQSSEIITGGTAGLALSMSYLTPWSFAVTFFLINLPFYVLSAIRMGWNFTLSTLFAVTTLSLMTEVMQYLPSFSLSPLTGALVGGAVIGAGLCILFLNKSSLGGANILSLVLQKRFGIDPGKTLFAFDTLVILTGLISVGLVRGLYSILSVLVISFIISLLKNRIARNNADTPAAETEPAGQAS
ncbi:YitT family protein [Alteribacter natronophilus]|uniref:YitT family protein n=1 Tax=Alteribacter natronophilus TaxID=2583810 RepID=UPI00110D471F|nr:YitT family protein [Alteribacter natronophilus]TMW73425.1 YitT family protein [Alteribacter natronophilus]